MYKKDKALNTTYNEYPEQSDHNFTSKNTSYDLMMGLRQYTSINITDKLAITNLIQLSVDPGDYLSPLNSFQIYKYRVQLQAGVNYKL